MKKLFIVAIAAVLCLSLAMPAMAEVKISGMVWVDAYVRSQDDAAADPRGYIPSITTVPLGANSTTSDGISDFQINGPLSQNYLNFAYANSKGTYGANMIIYQGYINDFSSWNEGGYASWIWWKPMPNLTLIIGKPSQILGGLYPTTGVGNAEYYRQLDDPAATGAFTGAGGMASGNGTGQVPAAITFGNLHSTAKPAIQAHYKVNDNVTVKFALTDPDYDNVDNDNFALLSTRGAGTTAFQEGFLPRFDLAVPMKFGNFYIQPKGGWLKKSYDQVAAGQPDDFDIWVIAADASITFGPLTLSGEYAIGQNMGAGNFTGGLSTQGPRGYFTNAPTNTLQSFSDTDQHMWFAELAWTITPKWLLKASYGQCKHEDEVNPAISTDDWEFNRSFMALNLRYAVAPNFFIHPSWNRLMYGEDNKYGLGALANGMTVDAGSLDLYGISFYVIF